MSAPRDRVLAALGDRTIVEWYLGFMHWNAVEMQRSDLAEWLMDLLTEGCKPVDEEQAWAEVDALWEDNGDTEDFWSLLEEL